MWTNYIIVAPPNTGECVESVAVLEKVCTRLGVPMTPGIKESPTTALIFQGIAIDTIAS